MNSSPRPFDLESPSLRLIGHTVPWDEAVFGFPVAQICELEIRNPRGARSDFSRFQAWRDAHQVRVVSCRLPHERLRESMFLEAHHFRFVEMVLQPRLDNLPALILPQDDLLITPGLASDLPALQDLAEHAFCHERYHLDPRLDPQLGDRRYGHWVRSSLEHPAQRLLKITDGTRLLALFIVESREDGSVYWHLNAIAPAWQGRGYGQRVWQAMLRYHQAAGCQAIVSTIAVRNVPVLNLYAKLNFHFLPPAMTFHWVRGDA